MENKTLELCQPHLILNNDMRRAWADHMIWTRAVITDSAANLPSLDYSAAKLLSTPKELGRIFSMYYPTETANKIERLITEHLAIGGDLIKAVVGKDQKAASEANARWYKNADEIAAYMGSINPFYSERDVKNMMYDHLRMVKEELALQLSGKYEQSIEKFDEIMDQGELMADYYVNGIMRQFPKNF